MRSEQITCLNRGRSKGEDCGHVKSIQAPPPSSTRPPPHPSEIFFTDRSKAVLLSWFIFVIVRLWMCVSLTSFCFGKSNCPFGFLLVMFPLGSNYFVFVFLSLWCLWWEVWDNCIDSWSLPSFLFCVVCSSWSIEATRCAALIRVWFYWIAYYCLVGSI